MTNLKEMYKEMQKKSCNKQLNNCTAWYDFFNINNKRVILLESYSTIVGFFDCETRQLFVFDYYSATTSQHVAKFEKMLYYIYDNDIMRINLYRRSDNVLFSVWCGRRYYSKTLAQFRKENPSVYDKINGYDFNKIFDILNK